LKENSNISSINSQLNDLIHFGDAITSTGDFTLIPTRIAKLVKNWNNLSFWCLKHEADAGGLEPLRLHTFDLLENVPLFLSSSVWDSKMEYTENDGIVMNKEILRKELTHTAGCRVLWYSKASDHDVYLDRYKIQVQKVDLVVTDQESLALRLNTFGIPVIISNSLRESIPSIFLACAEKSYPLVLPPIVPTIRSGHLHIMIQVANFDFPGGMERVVSEVASMLQNRGHKVTILNCGKSGPPQHDMVAQGIRVIELTKSSLVDRKEELKKLLVKEKPNLINAHYSWFGVDVAHDLSIPFVQTIHNEYTWLSSDERREFLEMDRFTTAYICVSSTAAMFSDLTLKLNLKKMIVIRNGVDEQRFQSKCNMNKLRRDLGITKNDFVMLQVGSLVPIKAPQFSIGAMKHVVTKHPNAKLFLLGKGMDRNYPNRLQAMIQKSHLQKNVQMLGHRTDIPCLLKLSHALLHPSILEGWCLAIAEALYLDKPVIIADTGGNRDIVSEFGGNGTIVLDPPYDSILTADINSISNLPQPQYETDIANAINSLIENYPVISKSDKSHLKSSYIYNAYIVLFQYIVAGKDITSLTSLFAQYF
jgi:glycosyltransferase involved in cell wall biosynthesis